MPRFKYNLLDSKQTKIATLLDDLNRINRKIDALTKQDLSDCYVSLFREKVTQNKKQYRDIETIFGMAKEQRTIQIEVPDTGIEFKFSGGTVHRIVKIMLDDLNDEKQILEKEFNQLIKKK